MKRIYATLGLLMFISSTSLAQSVDLQAYIQRPITGQIICPGELLGHDKVLMGIYYNGPDTIYSANDFVSYMTPFTHPANDTMANLEAIAFSFDITNANDSGSLLFTFPNSLEIGAGHISPDSLSSDSINYLYDWDLYNQNDSIVLVKPPYVVGQAYGFFMNVRGVRNQTNSNLAATDPNPVNDIAVVKIFWCSNVGIENMITANEATKIEVYPNPATSVINFSFDFEKPSHAQVVLRDVTGRVVYVKNFGKAMPSNQKYSIDISNFAPGLYSLEFNTDEKMAVTKFNIVK